MSKVSSVPFDPGSSRFKGEFKAAKFNLFEDEDLQAYAKLRSDANDAKTGVKIEHIREYSRKTTKCAGQGDDQVVTTTEEIFMVVQYWEKKPAKIGDSDEDAREARREWSEERSASE